MGRNDSPRMLTVHLPLSVDRAIRIFRMQQRLMYRSRFEPGSFPLDSKPGWNGLGRLGRWNGAGLHRGIWHQNIGGLRLGYYSRILFGARLVPGPGTGFPMEPFF